MKSKPVDELRRVLQRIDGRGYKAYKEIRGSWALPHMVLVVDHVQGDPYAAPSRVRIFLEGEYTDLPGEACVDGSRAVGTGAFLARAFAGEARRVSRSKGSGKSGEIRMEAPGQEVLRQTAVGVGPEGDVEARFTVGLPARGRRVMGQEAVRILTEDVPEVVAAALRAPALGVQEIVRHARANEDADALRALLPERGLVAFVADGAALPRQSGIRQEPLTGERVVPFSSPESLRTEVELPNAGTVSGMGIPRGVTLIVGGGYHGKSTLLRALERGVYNHRPGDGRELTVSLATTVKVRAEDGRSVQGVDISPFIENLPLGEDTRSFTSPNASGSTSQAANIMEAVEAGAGLLLVDEDTAATNFMIRDRRMQALVPREKEPITPFVDRIRQLHGEWSVSSILALGGSGDYLEVADTVIAMDRYRPRDVTRRAREVAKELPTGRAAEVTSPLGPLPARAPLPSSIDPRRGKRKESLKVRGTDTLLLGREEIDLGAVEQIVSPAQARALGRGLLLAWREYMDGETALSRILDRVEAVVEEEGLDVLDRWISGDLAAFRRFELAAALNRLRTLNVRAARESPDG